MKTLLAALPSSSAFVEAQLNDPEVAEQLAAGPEQGPSAPRVSDWSPDVARLTDIFDRLGELIAATYAAAGAKPPSPTPMPRPRTAVDRLRAKARQSRYDALVAEVKAAQARHAGSDVGA